MEIKSKLYISELVSVASTSGNGLIRMGALFTLITGVSNGWGKIYSDYIGFWGGYFFSPERALYTSPGHRPG